MSDQIPTPRTDAATKIKCTKCGRPCVASKPDKKGIITYHHGYKPGPIGPQAVVCLGVDVRAQYDSAYREGVTAGMREQPSSKNPYPKHTGRRNNAESWARGWIAGREKKKSLREEESK